VTSFDLDATVDGVSQPTFHWTGSLASGATTSVTVSNYSFSNFANYVVSGWTSIPNGNTDGLQTNDMATVTVHPSLCGVYTIGGASPDFATIGDAVSALNAYGLGGSVMLIYEDFTPERENQFEIRYTNIELTSFDSSPDVEGHSSSQSLGLWARRRVPTGFTVLGNTIRGVLEFAHTQYLGDNRGALGFNFLSSVGTGLELDLKNYDIFFTRARLMFRYQFAPDVNGYSIGMAVSF
jgi:hypothetical protein